MIEPLIRFDRVTKRFDAVVALEDVSFDVRPGEFLALCGENGAGKSTLMKILSGVITDYDGQIFVAGEPLVLQGTRDAEARGISIIHQELNLVGDLSVAANIFLGRELRSPLGLLDDRRMEREAAAQFESLECRIDPCAPVRSLRIGDQQLVEIAKALGAESRGQETGGRGQESEIRSQGAQKVTTRCLPSASCLLTPAPCPPHPHHGRADERAHRVRGRATVPHHRATA